MTPFRLKTVQKNTVEFQEVLNTSPSVNFNFNSNIVIVKYVTLSAQTRRVIPGNSTGSNCKDVYAKFESVLQLFILLKKLSGLSPRANSTD
jgi:hypothetical protein